MRNPAAKVAYVLLLLSGFALAILLINYYFDKKRPQVATNDQEATANASEKARIKKKPTSATRHTYNEQFAARDNETPVSQPVAEAILPKRQFQPVSTVRNGTTRSELTSEFGPPDLTLSWSERGMLNTKFVYLQSSKLTIFVLVGDKVTATWTDAPESLARTDK